MFDRPDTAGHTVRVASIRAEGQPIFLDYFALAVLVFVAVTLFYAIIAIHDIPYEIAKHRDHPHQDAIHVAGWVSLFTLHAIWPFLWIWATLYRPDRGWGIQRQEPEVQDDVAASLKQLEDRIAQLERRRRVGKKAKDDVAASPNLPEDRIARLERRRRGRAKT